MFWFWSLVLVLSLPWRDPLHPLCLEHKISFPLMMSGHCRFDETQQSLHSFLTEKQYMLARYLHIYRIECIVITKIIIIIIKNYIIVSQSGCCRPIASQLYWSIIYTHLFSSIELLIFFYFIPLSFCWYIHPCWDPPTRRACFLTHGIAVLSIQEETNYCTIVHLHFSIIEKSHTNHIWICFWILVLVLWFFWAEPK